jgi:hypothetical protein
MQFFEYGKSQQIASNPPALQGPQDRVSDIGGLKLVELALS